MGYKRAKIKMKKSFIMSLMAILSIYLATNLFAVPNPVPDYEQCAEFKNVKATIKEDGDGMICVCFESKNEGTTKVAYEVTGWFGYNPELLRRGIIEVPAYGKVRTEKFPNNGCPKITVKIHNCHSK
jgi:hypothetical protein